MIDITRVPILLRLALIIAFAIPLIYSHSVLHSPIHPAHFFSDLALWAMYASFLWMIILLCYGLETLLNWLAIAVIFGLTVLLTGELVRYIGLWEGIAAAIKYAFPTSELKPETGDSTVRLIGIFMTTIIATPYALFAVNSFPGGELVRIAAFGHSRKGGRATLITLAMVLRIFQHVFEIIVDSMVSWKEENPTVYRPRFRTDWMGSFAAKFYYLEWVRTSVWIWCKTLLIRSALIVPTIVRDFGRFLTPS
jgi:hypothetical protein